MLGCPQRPRDPADHYWVLVLYYGITRLFARPNIPLVYLVAHPLVVVVLDSQQLVLVKLIQLIEIGVRQIPIVLGLWLRRVLRKPDRASWVLLVRAHHDVLQVTLNDRKFVFGVHHCIELRSIVPHLC